MRRAGCVRVSVGVETGDPAILEQMRKRLDLERAVQVTADARSLGMDVRYHLIFGSPGESPASLRATDALVMRARPTSFIMSLHSILPGTEDFAVAVKQGLLSLEDYFTCRDEFYVLRHFQQQPQETRQALLAHCPRWGVDHAAVSYTLGEREAIYARHGDLLLTALDLADAYIRAGRFSDAELVLDQSQQRTGRNSILSSQYRACIRCAQGDSVTASQIFTDALAKDPDDTLLTLSYLTLVQPPAGVRDHRTLAGRILANLRSITTTIHLLDGARDSVAPLAASKL